MLAIKIKILFLFKAIEAFSQLANFKLIYANVNIQFIFHVNFDFAYFIQI